MSTATTNPDTRITDTYTYTDETGNPLFEVVRYDNPKTFRQRQPNGGPDHIRRIRRVLYRLQEIRKANLVFIVEGEKDVHALGKIGLTATTNPMGAGNWIDDYANSFQPHQDVVVIPDNDEAGLTHAWDILCSLYGKVASVRFLKLTNLPEKGDVSDWLQNGGTREELMALVETAPRPVPQPEDRGTGTAGDPAGKDDRKQPWPHQWFNETHNIDDLLKDAGFTSIRSTPDGRTWHWPGASNEGSANSRGNKVTIFSETAARDLGIPVERIRKKDGGWLPFDPFEFFAYTKHEGDLGAAARAAKRDPNYYELDNEQTEQAGSSANLRERGANSDSTMSDNDNNSKGGATQKKKREPKKPLRMKLAKLIREARPHLRFWKGQFWHWNGRFYEKLDRMVLENEIRDLINEKWQIAPARNLVGEALLDLRSMCWLDDNIQADSWLDRRAVNPGSTFISVANGIVEIPPNDAPLELHDHSPEWFTLTSRPYDYNPDAKCSKWLEFQNQITEHDQDRIAIKQEWFGLSLTSRGFRHYFYVAVGGGRNGKGVESLVATSLVGEDNVSGLPLAALASQFDAEILIGKSLNISSEAEEVSNRAETELKKYSGGDKVNVNRKHEKAIEYYPTVRFWLLTNQMPRFQDTRAMFDRMILMPYQKYIPLEERIDDYDQVLCKELSGIFNWAIDGLRRLRKNGKFTRSTVCAKAAEDYRLSVNPAKRFLTENAINGEKELVSVRCEDLFKFYKQWCNEKGEKNPGNDRDFGKAVKDVFPNSNHKRETTGGTDGQRKYRYYGVHVPEENWPPDLRPCEAHSEYAVG